MSISTIQNTFWRRFLWTIVFPCYVVDMVVRGVLFHGYRPWRHGGWLERMGTFFLIGWDGHLIEEDRIAA